MSGFLSRLRGPTPPDPPGWAAVMSGRRFVDFQQVVGNVAPEILSEPVIHWDEGYIQSGEAEYGLHNLVQMCARDNARGMESRVREFLSRISAGFAEQEEMESRPNYSRIKLRLLPLDIEADTEFFSFPISDAFHTVLAYDGELCVALYSVASVDNLPFTRDELFDLGLKNVLAEELPEYQVLKNGDTKIHCLSGDSFFVASRVLALEQLLDHRPEHGVLFSVPNRHIVFYHVMGDGDPNEATAAIVHMTQKQFDRGPGSISPCLFWWKDGRYETLYYGVKEFEPSSQFLEALGTCSERSTSG